MLLDKFFCQRQIPKQIYNKKKESDIILEHFLLYYQQFNENFILTDHRKIANRNAFRVSIN